MPLRVVCGIRCGVRRGDLCNDPRKEDHGEKQNYDCENEITKFHANLRYAHTATATSTTTTTTFVQLNDVPRDCTATGVTVELATVAATADLQRRRAPRLHRLPFRKSLQLSFPIRFEPVVLVLRCFLPSLADHARDPLLFLRLQQSSRLPLNTRGDRLNRKPPI
jgi:hypothetical protein